MRLSSRFTEDKMERKHFHPVVSRRLYHIQRGYTSSVPSYSPDGNSLVFSREGDDYLDNIYTVNLNSGAVKRVTNARDIHPKVSNPVFSPDGKWIAFSEHWEDCEETTHDNCKAEIYAVNGCEKRNISNDRST